MTTINSHRTLLALDVGERRIGVAKAHLEAAFPAPLCTLDDPTRFIEDILALCRSENAAALVVGMPRGLSGQHTAQTEFVEKFIEELETQLDIPVYWIDEALTSAKAEEELRGRGQPYAKGDVDSLAATYILEDFISSHKGKIAELTHG